MNKWREEVLGSLVWYKDIYSSDRYKMIIHWTNKIVDSWKSNKFFQVYLALKKRALFEKWFYNCKWTYDGEDRRNIGILFLHISYGSAGYWEKE